MTTGIRLRRPLSMAFIALTTTAALMASDARAHDVGGQLVSQASEIAWLRVRLATAAAPPNAPVVNAGADQSVDAGALGILSGIFRGPVSVIDSLPWVQTGGPEVLISNGGVSPGIGGAIALFTAPAVAVGEAVLTFQLTVPYDDGLTVGDSVTITVRAVDTDANGFVASATGLNFTCGIVGDGSIDCFGENFHIEQAELPAGVFTAITAGAFHACAIRDTGEVACFGYDGAGRTTTPAGVFTEINAGESNTCGIRESGETVCWGEPT